MNRWKRLAFYLLINVLVSACTMVTVLFLWDRFRAVTPATVDPQAAVRPTAGVLREPSSTPPPTPVPTPALEAYQVQPGDTLGSIAARFGISIEELQRINNLADPNTLGSGQILLVPVTPVPPAATPTTPASPVPDNPQPATVTLAATDQDLLVEITAIVGAGVLQDERVVIRFGGDGELSLHNWQLQDDDGNRYEFPQLSLFKGGEVWVYSRAGANTVVELHWGRTETVWRVGETARLLDPGGAVRATYQVP